MDEIILSSKKIKFNKFFKLATIVVVISIVLTLTISIFQYTNYLQMQSRAVDLMKATSDKYDNFSGSYGELVEEMYFDLNPSSYSYNINGYQIENSGVVDAALDADLALGKALLGDDWFYDSGSDYLKFTGLSGYFEFYFKDISGLADNGLFSIISFSAALFVLLLNLSYKLIANKELLITEDMVICKSKNKTIKQFMIKNITSVESLFLGGLKFTGNGINHSVFLIKNTDEIRNHIINKISTN